MIGRWLVYGISVWCVVLGLWNHDWRLIGAGIAVCVLFPIVDGDGLVGDEES